LYSERWSPGLRQGDIVGEIAFPSFGAELQVMSTTQSLVPGTAGQSIQQVFAPVELRYVAIASHDCEFNEEKRNKLLVARIQNIPGNLTDDEVVALRASNDFEAQAAAVGKIEGVDAFVIEPIEGCFADERIVVFHSIIALPMKMKAALVDAKRAEMDQACRVLFRKKLAWFFGRDADDIDEAQKFEPPVKGVESRDSNAVDPPSPTTDPGA
jgi:hypothetical protein